MPPASAPAVLHHSALPHRGGAVRVARLLQAAQLAGGQNARLSFEVAENDPEAPEAASLEAPTLPGEVSRALAQLGPGAALHLHTSTNWPELLGGLVVGPIHNEPQRQILLTLHDAGPLTGGCAYPLSCALFPACADPCPRRFPQAALRQAITLELLRRLCPALISPSRWLAGLARQALPELPARVIPNGVPWPEQRQLPSRARARAVLGLPPAAPVALFAAHGGGGAAYKSGSLWPEYWERLRGQLPDALGFAVGGDETWSSGGFTTWPYVDRAKLQLLMRAADALVYPALADNHPLVLLEAAANELPVAAYAVGGVPEIVSPGETGLLAPPGDKDAFCAAALALLSNPAQGRRLGQNARAHGAKRFTAGRMAADYAALLA